MAEDIDEVPGALWKQSLFDDYRVNVAPPLTRIVIGVDPSGGSTTEVGIVAAGLGTDGHGYILRDSSILATTPKQWAAKITWDYSELKADRVVGETNYGGDMVETTIKLFDENMSYKNVTATRGKLVRAEPICALYEKGYVHHVGTGDDAKKFALLEEECCSYVPGDKHSPNRMDAMVWAMTELFPENQRLALVEQAKEEQAMRVQQSTLMKPAINAKTEACSFCGKNSIVRRGPIKHCTACGKEDGGPMRGADDGERQTRANFFK
jgi:phage terminase large subunit-like protein